MVGGRARAGREDLHRQVLRGVRRCEIVADDHGNRDGPGRLIRRRRTMSARRSSGSIVAPEGAPEPRLYVNGKGGVFGSEA